MLEIIMSNGDLILTTVTGIVTVTSLIVAGTKTPDPDSVMGKIYKDSLEKVKERNKIETEINMLSSADVSKRLRKRWRREDNV